MQIIQISVKSGYKNLPKLSLITRLLIWSFGCYFLPVNVRAQQRPRYTHYMFSNFLVNPALSGIENYMELKVGRRQQWVGLEGAPVTSYLSLHAPLGNKYKYENVNSFAGNGTNPMSRSYVREYRAAEPHHGIGFHLVSDQAGPFKRNDLNATYSYHLGLAPKLNLAVGFGAGLTHSNIELDQFSSEMISDPAINGLHHKQLKPALSTGIWLYSPMFFVGISGEQLMEGLKGSSNDQIGQKMVPHFYGTAGYKLFLGDEMALLPSVMFTRVSTTTFVDFNSKLAFRDLFWIGGSYRKGDSFSGLAGFNISHLLNISYAYDYNTSALRKVSNGSHEIVLGLLLNNRYKVTCPQNQF